MRGRIKTSKSIKFVTLIALLEKAINRDKLRKSGLASNPLFILPDFFLHFPNELSYGYLRFEGNRKIPLGK